MTGPGSGEVLVYEDPDGKARVEVRLERDTVWLSLTQMAELFGRDKSVISRHLQNVFRSGELERKATVAKNATVQREAGRQVVREIEFFNLDAILSVGYRVNSKRGTQFRIWATNTYANTCCAATRSTTSASSAMHASWKPRWPWCARRRRATH
ncbi:MAG TPA: RhuM family protein [Burkholderiaceae bacterium]|nr:RhuM family protein [Burkholderiaceae bacterium]